MASTKPAMIVPGIDFSGFIISPFSIESAQDVSVGHYPCFEANTFTIGPRYIGLKQITEPRNRNASGKRTNRASCRTDSIIYGQPHTLDMVEGLSVAFNNKLFKVIDALTANICICAIITRPANFSNARSPISDSMMKRIRNVCTDLPLPQAR